MTPPPASPKTGTAAGHGRLPPLFVAAGTGAVTAIFTFVLMVPAGWPQALVAPSAAPPASVAAPAAPPAGPSAGPPPGATADIFAPRTWEPPPPPPPPAAPPAPAAPPPKPEPPPLPFGYLGQMSEPGEPTVVYLSRGSDVLAVRRGDRIAGGYRVGEIRNGQLRFRYQPLNADQFLPVGSP